MNVATILTRICVMTFVSLGTLMDVQYSALTEKEATVKYATELGAYSLERVICDERATFGTARGVVAGRRGDSAKGAVNRALEAAEIGMQQQGSRVTINVVGTSGEQISTVKEGDTLCIETTFKMHCGVSSVHTCAEEAGDSSLTFRSRQCVVARGCDAKDEG